MKVSHTKSRKQSSVRDLPSFLSDLPNDEGIRFWHPKENIQKERQILVQFWDFIEKCEQAQPRQ